MRRSIVFAVFLLALAGAAPASRPTPVVLSLPAAGAVSAQWLPDGTPVFVIHVDGAVRVVGATARLADGVATAVAWCPAQQVFFGVWTGGMFLADGRLLGGIGPSLPLHPSRRTQDSVVITGPPDRARHPVPRDEIPRRFRRGIDTNGCYDLIDLEPRQVVQHDLPARGAVAVEQLQGPGHGRTVLVRGILARDAAGRPAVCTQVSTAPPRRCVSPAVPIAPSGDLFMPIADVVLRGHLRHGALRKPVLVAVTRIIAPDENAPATRS